MASDFDHWFQPIRSPVVADPVEENRHVLLCFPYSGQGTAMFAPWRKLLPPALEGYAVKLPGRETKLREPPRTELVPLAQELAEVVAAAAGQTNLYLVGFSMGGLIAFELAHALAERAIPIRLLAVGATRAPHRDRYRTQRHKLSEQKFLKKMDRLYGGVAWQVLENEEARGIIVPMLRGDIQMYETYDYRERPPLDCEVLTMLGQRDRVVAPKHVLAWRDLARTHRHRGFDGDHFFAKQTPGPTWQTIAARIRRVSPNGPCS